MTNSTHLLLLLHVRQKVLGELVESVDDVCADVGCLPGAVASLGACASILY